MEKKMVKKHFQSTLLAILFLFVSVCFVGCTNKNVYSEVEKDSYMMYKNLSYGDNQRNVLDLCLPKNKTSAGMILFIHGGGWTAGDKDVYESELQNWCNNYGFATCALNYRYADAPKVVCEDLLDDITLAMMKVKSFAQTKGIAVEKMLLTGGSAGGHLSLQYAYEKGNISPIKPAAVVSFCGPTDLADVNFYDKTNSLYDALCNMISKLVGYKVNFENREYAKPILLQASPINYVDYAVPTVICHGMVDDIVPYSNATTLYNLLVSKGVQTDIVSFEHSGHGLDQDPEAMQQANALMLQYAQNYLG